MTGRKPTPTNLKVLRGNPGKRKLNKQEPQPPAGVPECPDWLSEKARLAWDEVAPVLHKMGVLTVIDRLALSALCESYADYRDSREAVEDPDIGRVYETQTQTGGTMFRARPEVLMLKDADRRLRSWLAEFGMTPSSRSRIQTGDAGEEDPFKAFLNAKKA